MSFMLRRGEHYGRIRRQLTYADITLSDVLYAPESRNESHANLAALIVFVKTGGYDKQVGAQSMVCSAGQAIFVPAQHSQADVFRASTTHCVIAACSNSVLNRFREVGVALPNQTIFLRTDFASTVAKLEQELSDSDAFSPLLVEGLMLEALVRSNRRARCDSIDRRPVWLRRAKELLRDDAVNVKSISSIAAAVGIHPARLSTDFRRAYGYTPGEYLRRMRVRRAAQLLNQSDARICDIASQCGFSDQAHLTRLFQKQMNCTPAQFRRRLSH